jgi:hypothetical protein
MLIKRLFLLFIISAFSGVTSVRGEESRTIKNEGKELIYILNTGPVNDAQAHFLPALNKYISSIRSGDAALNADLILKASKYAYFMADQSERAKSYAAILQMLNDMDLESESYLEAKRICTGQINLTGKSSTQVSTVRAEFEDKALNYVEILMRGGDGTITQKEANTEISYILGLNFVEHGFRAKCLEVRHVLQTINSPAEKNIMKILNELKVEKKSESDRLVFKKVIESVRSSIEVRKLAGIKNELLAELESFLREAESSEISRENNKHMSNENQVIYH